MSLQPGTSFGPYAIIAPLGAGGMGEVYRARDTRLGREIAIKTLPESLATDPERLGRFRREAETLAALNHPNIATIFGLEQIDGVLALAMELVEGPTLADRIARGPIPAAEALPLAKQLSLALEAAHERGIIHRDLKPANVKLTADGSVKLLDFGLAKALDVESSGPGGSGRPSGVTASPTMSVMATRAGVLLGTAAYMSPEQVRASVVDKRADIWAFGVVLYEILTGRGLFGGDTISDTLAGVLREPIDLARLPAGVPSPIRQLIARCLERDPKRRLRDIGEARIAIDDYMAHPQAGVPAHAERPASTPLWRRVAPWMLAVAFASAAVFLALKPRSQAARSEDAATFDFAFGGLLLQRGGIAGGFVAISSDGRRVVMAAAPSESGQGPSRSQQRLYQRTLEGGDFVAIPGTEISSVPFISPDGEWVGFESRGQLRKVAFAGGVAIRICDAATTVAGATWMDDHSIVFASGGRLLRVADGGGAPRSITADKSDGSTYSWPSAIRGRNAVLATLRSGAAGSGGKFRVMALDLQSGRETPVAEGSSYARYVNGFVVYAQQSNDERGGNPFTGALLAVPFDVARLEPTGPPTAVLAGVRVHNGGAANYDVATNGTAVWVHGGEVGQPEMIWLPLRADATSRTAESLAFAKGGLAPRMSSDGSLVTYQVGLGNLSAVFVGSLDRGAVNRIPFEGPAARPIFGPEAAMVTFTAAGTSMSPGQGLWIGAIDGSTRPERLTTSSHLQVPGAWSRDGAQLVFVDFKEQNGDVLVLRRSGSPPEPIAATAADERDATLSPDDRWLAYASNETGPMEVYVRPLRGAAARYTVSSGGGEMPAWSPDGRRLFYIRPPFDLMAVDVIQGVSFSVSAPHLVMSAQMLARPGTRTPTTTRTFDIAPDGRLITTRDPSTDTAADALRLTLHFDQVIRRRFAPIKP